ncbi:MATE family efflux transporter [Fibrobacter sp. UWH4]|uniref:MATE family efflux transporter n=1 Tax=Fibrobacter sp. UWH4 TaxID=1896210 RepID=UPI00090F4A42|nr:MATE family efflux transporter [Fibrobacter sp. UWH4]SHK33304.1 multidrug resistance protein, MATE family [Fibrobacter sp. UWH4]
MVDAILNRFYRPSRFKKNGDVKDVLVVALPMLLSMSFDTLMTFIDRLFLSKLGPAEMNAALGAGAVQLALTMFFTGMISYTTAMVAQRLGGKRRWDCARAFMQALYVSLMCVPLLYLTIPLGHVVFGMEHLPADQLQYQKTYFNILMFGGVINLVRNVAPCFFSGIGETKIVMKAAFVGMLVNVACNFVLIYGMGPIPALGVAGAAYGTLIGNLVSTVILFAKFFGKSCHRRFRTRYAFAFSWPLTQELLKKGIPSGVEMFLNMSAFQLLILMFHALGPESATASSVMFNWDMVAYVPLMGLEVASTSLVGRYVGAKDGAAASRSTYSGLKLGWGYSLLMGIFFIFLPGILTDIFKPDVTEASAEAIAIFESARPMSIFMLRIATLYIFVEVLLVIYAGALRGAGDTLWVMFACAIMNWCVAGSLYLVAYVFGLPAHLAWIAVVAVYSTAPVLFWLRWKNGKWRRHILDV